ncbi:MAG: peptidase M23 [Flavobacteriales bacterium]|nr:peptidase M23 [Flavobacteriales bacterium]MAC96634.1 peptidase M23 [Flavobacteriales bacterium]|tara:strand:+ start:6354 stop:7640 length:1287 start_codon:yes stop_codon:yes gene_type:complete
MKKKIRLISSILFLLLTVSVLLFINKYQKDQKIEEAYKAKAEQNADTLLLAEPQTQFGIEIDSFHIVEAKIKPNEFLANILLSFNIDYVTIDQLAEKSKDVFDVRQMRAGKKYTVFASKDSLKKASYFVYQPNKVEYIVYDLSDSISIYKGEKEVEIRQESVSGVIYSSLYESLQAANASPALAVELSEILAWSIDFYRIQKGDWFKAIYEVKYVDDQAIGIGRVIAVEFNHFDKTFYGFYFDQDGKEDYFDEEANSLRKAFLKSPLKFSRLSSRYTMRRFHPVQKRWKAHLGTDYAAPTGTPIMSTGDGQVIASSYTGGNGNYVKIKHNSVYTTQYLHMSKRKARVGDYVKQGDIIGYVGSTGLATGPHVCYRFWKNGKQVDHLKQDFPSAEPVKDEHKEEFQQKMQKLKKELDSISLNSKEEFASK